VVHPGRLIRGLATAAAKRGAHIAETTTVRRVRPIRGSDAVELETSAGRLRARHVVVAANVATGRLIPALARAFTPVRGQMLSTSPLRPLFRPAMAIDWGAVYWRQNASGAIVLGGCAAVDGAAERTSRDRLNPRIQAALSEVLNEAFPDLPPLRIARRWAGIMDQTVDRRPVVGRWPSGSTQWVVAGFGGHGLPPAIAVGQAVAAAIVDGNTPPTLDRFDPRRFARPGRPVPAAGEVA
jgi:glycine/D-amino acid oxidase-like deaminating enzyme